jgi:hypothetical protein
MGTNLTVGKLRDICFFHVSHSAVALTGESDADVRQAPRQEPAQHIELLHVHTFGFRAVVVTDVIVAVSAVRRKWNIDAPKHYHQYVAIFHFRDRW